MVIGAPRRPPFTAAITTGLLLKPFCMPTPSTWTDQGGPRHEQGRHRSSPGSAANTPAMSQYGIADTPGHFLIDGEGGTSAPFQNEAG